jgi:hypothetical protein
MGDVDLVAALDGHDTPKPARPITRADYKIMRQKKPGGVTAG